MLNNIVKVIDYMSSAGCTNGLGMRFMRVPKRFKFR